MFIRLSLFVVISLLGFASFASASAQTDAPTPCLRVRETGSAAAHGYLFKSYDAVNPDEPACLRIYHNGRIVYRLGGDREYYIGQPGDSEYKIPGVLNGADLTGDGRPDVIVKSWSGGAHCCYTHYIFELKPTLHLLAKIADGDDDLSHFERMRDGRHYYYVTQDIWSYWPASFASSVHHKVILRWNGKRFRLNLSEMRYPPPTPAQWKAALKDVDDALREGGGDVRGSLGVTLWDTVLDLIYTGHSDLAWMFVRDVNPASLKGDNPSLEEFCIGLKGSIYWNDLEPSLRDVPKECAAAKSEVRN